jgi:hypothetical protein
VNSRDIIRLLIGSAIALCLVACGGSGSTPPPSNPITVSFLSQPPASLNTGSSTGLAAAVANDSSNAGVTWKVSCTASSCGTVSPASTSSGGAATYTAPGNVPSPATVTVTATSVSDATKSASASITITSAGPPPAIAVAFVTQPPSSMVINTTTSLAASVTNDSKNGGVNWSVTCGSAQCGSFAPTRTASGSSTTYTAPGAVPSGSTVTVTATSVTDNTKSTSATITISAAPPPLLGDGAYVFQFSGQDNNGPYDVVGAFAVKNGTIIGGEQDFTDPILGSADQLVASGCSISTAGNNIQVVLATANNQIGVNGVETLRGTIVNSSRVLVSEFDSFAAATGSIDLQTNTAAPSGGYAFAINGTDATQNANQLVIGGVLNFSGTTLSTANSVFDFNDAADPLLPAQSFASGSVTAPDAYGRVIISLTPSIASGVPNFNLTGYLVDGSKMQLLESQQDVLNANLGGTALSQGSKSGTFSQNSVINSTYVYGNVGQDGNGPLILGGSFTFGPGGGATGLLAFNDLANNTGNSFSGATYAVDATGRVTITNVVPSNLSNISLTFQLYLDGNGNALALGNDIIQETAGLAYQQNAPSDYEGGYAVAVQGFLNGPTYEQPYGAVGPVTITSEAFNGYSDYTSQNQTPQPQPQPTPFQTYANTPLTGLEDTSNGLLNLTGLNSVAFTQPGAFGYYGIDGNRLLAIEVDGNGLGLLMLESTGQAPSQ